MRDDEIKNILRGAEADLAPSALVASELAGRVRAAQRTQRRRRRFAVAASLPLPAALAFAAWHVTPHSNRTTSVPTTPQVALAPSDEIDRLIAVAEAHERKARVLIAARPPRDAALDDDPLAGFREQVDIVAYRMILRADELQANMRVSREGIEIYERVLRDFPGTHSAEVAQERLTAAGSQGVES